MQGTTVGRMDRFELPVEWINEKIFLVLGEDEAKRLQGVSGTLLADLHGAVRIQTAHGQEQVWPKDNFKAVFRDSAVRLAVGGVSLK